MSIDVIIGTRPEAIKMAPVIRSLRSSKDLRVRVIATGQHTDMLRQPLAFFGISPDIDLDVMKEAQSLDHITSAVLVKLGHVFDEGRPDAILVHGDTTTTMASSLAAFYRRIPIGHVEAGLRSGDLDRPFPEEMNRVFTDRIARWWFAPTSQARDNLLSEGVDDRRIYVTGNTVVDALRCAAAETRGPKEESIAKFADGRKFILLTAHRRESWGEPMKDICRAAREIADRHDVDLIVPMHKNPAVRETIRDILGDCPRAALCEPLDYPDFVWALKECELILSDSGGVQEEATALAKPVIILREVTERPEAVEHGSGVIAGTDARRIIDAAEELLTSDDARRAIAEKCASSPFGDGRASERITEIMEGELASMKHLRGASN